MRLLKVGGKLSGGENVWWQCVEKDGKTVYLNNKGHQEWRK